MPVTKFRNIEEMNAFDRTRWIERGNPELATLIRENWRRFRGWFPSLDLPKGVHKFRSFEEMCAWKEGYENQRIERLRAEREKK